MTELKQEHFEVIDANKQKAYEEQKEMREEMAFFVLNCSTFKMQQLYNEYKRIKKDIKNNQQFEDPFLDNM